METEFLESHEAADGRERLRVLRRRRRITALVIPFSFVCSAFLGLLIDLVLYEGSNPFVVRFLSLVVASGIVIYYLVLTVQIRRLRKLVGPVPLSPLSGKQGFKKTISWAVAILIFDGLVSGGLLSSFLALVCVMFILVPMSAFAYDDALSRFHLKKAGILVTAVCASFGIFYLNLRIAERTAGRVIDGVVQYKEKYGQFPEDLEDLVPEFMPRIPLAKWTLLYNDFTYITTNGPTLWYREMPPFGRRVYNFASEKWGMLD